MINTPNQNEKFRLLLLKVIYSVRFGSVRFDSVRLASILSEPTRTRSRWLGRSIRVSLLWLMPSPGRWGHEGWSLWDQCLTSTSSKNHMSRFSGPIFKSSSTLYFNTYEYVILLLLVCFSLCFPCEQSLDWVPIRYQKFSSKPLILFFVYELRL